MTRSQAAVVEADDETMQLSNSHESVVCADDASASPRRMVTHQRTHTRITGLRRGRVKCERVKSRTRREGPRRRGREEVEPRGERGHEAKRESTVRTEQER